VITVTLLGTGSPIPHPDRAGPATLVSVGDHHVLVDAGRGVLMRLAAAGLGVDRLAGVLVTHLHSDHVTDLTDLITSTWVMTFTPTPLRIVGPPGTRQFVDHLLASLGPDIGYRMTHHVDLPQPPIVEVTEVTDGPVDAFDIPMRISAAPTDHRPADPSVGYRIEADSPDGTASVVLAGDTVPCAGLDRLCDGADALVHTVIRKDVIAKVPLQRMQDTLDYHSSPEEAAATAARNDVGTLVLTHYVPAPLPGGLDEWRALAAAHFDGTVEAGDDLHTVTVRPRASR